MMGRIGYLKFAVAIVAVAPMLCLSFQPMTQSSKLGASAIQTLDQITSSRWNTMIRSPLLSDSTRKVRRCSVSTLASTATSSDTATKVSIVSVCTAELCNCQEEGSSGDDILKNLLAKNLPYPVEEAPCLGACGGGAMVAIDFEDGSAALVSGIDETLMELGLPRDDEDTAEAASTLVTAVSSEPVASSASPDVGSTPIATSSESAAMASSTAVSPPSDSAPCETKTDNVQGMADTATQTMPVTAATTKEVVKPTEKKPSSNDDDDDGYQDARDRMRAQAAADTETASNPWWTAATYLAQKAKESIMDKDKKQ